MKNLPLISIAVCTYNGEKYLQEQLDSLVNQTYSNIEIIVVDDCSTDSTAEILKSYSEKHNNFYVYFNEKNLGLSKNFEKAILLCKGDYIAISDQDDIWNLEKIAVLYENIGDNILIHAKSVLIDAEGNPINNSKIIGSGNFEGSDPRTITIINYIWGHRVLFKRELINYFSPLPDGMDYDWFIGITSLNYGQVRYLEQPLVQHRKHSTNATSRISSTKDIDDLRVRLRVISKLKDLKYPDFFNKFLKYSKQDNFLGKLSFFSFLIKNRKIIFKASNKKLLSNLNDIRKIAFY